jgi:hypothetical protein
MRNLLFSVFAIGVAAVAAMTATTAMLNAPRRSVPAAITAATAQPGGQSSALAPDTKPAVDEKAPAAKPGGTPDTAKPANGAASSKDAAGKDKDEEADKDPYEGIAPEELPPDLQYSADSSVSFPTNI